MYHRYRCHEGFNCVTLCPNSAFSGCANGKKAYESENASSSHVVHVRYAHFMQGTIIGWLKTDLAYHPMRLIMSHNDAHVWAPNSESFPYCMCPLIPRQSYHCLTVQNYLFLLDSNVLHSAHWQPAIWVLLLSTCMYTFVYGVMLSRA